MRIKETPHKSKFDKTKCAKCQYRGIGSIGQPCRIKGRYIRLYCNFSGITDITCLKPEVNNNVVDLRGEDYNNCKLFIEGPIVEHSKQIRY